MKVLALCAVIGALSLPASLQTTKAPPKKPVARSKTSTTPSRSSTSKVPPKTDEKTEWDRVTTIHDSAERIAALEKFIRSFPKGQHLTEASGLIAAAHVDNGNALVGAGSLDAAVSEYKAGIQAAPMPVVQGFWDEGLSRIPTNLYFHSRQEAALAMAKLLEEKATGAQQQLSIATFYLTIEDGEDARRVAEGVIASEPGSAAAYRTLGLAGRVDFDLGSAAAAFAKAVELDPDSIESRQGLAEMKRALGRSDEAFTLYQEILAKDPQNIAARTGKVMAMFDSGKQPEAEAELTSTLEAAPANVILLASAAYWYAAHGLGDKAVEYAQKAIAQEPRFVWSYIALSRGLLLQGKAPDAERALVTARQYGNFPTLDYELAATRLAGGYYREAAEALSNSFQSKDGAIVTSLGGRVSHGSANFADLIADERRASIFAPTAADDPDTQAQLAALLDLRQQLDAASHDEAKITAVADKFVQGQDPMRAHRELFVASQLLDKKLAIGKALELARSAMSGVDSAVSAGSSSTAVMASEIYGARQDAAMRGEYVNVPDIPKATQAAIMRGRIEDIIGWAEFQKDNNDDAIIHLKRAVSVLPADSAWWRTSTWHLGSALALGGKDTEALESYIRSYKGSTPDAIRYSVIEALYRKVNGSADGLAAKIGDNPAQAVNAGSVPPASTQVEATPETTPAPTPTPAPQPTPDYVTAIPRASPLATPQPESAVAPDASPAATPGTVVTPSPSPEPSLAPTATPEPQPSPAPSPEPIVTLTPSATPLVTEQPSPLISPTPEPTAEPTPEASQKPVKSTPAIVVTDGPTSPSPTPKEAVASTTTAKTRDLFPPVIITIPPPTRPRSTEPKAADDAVKETSTPDNTIPPCSLTLSEDSITLNSRGGDLAVIVGRDDDADVDQLTAESSSTADIAIRREIISGVRTRALYAIRSVSQKTGLFQVTFSMPCGRKTLSVRVR